MIRSLGDIMLLLAAPVKGSTQIGTYYLTSAFADINSFHFRAKPNTLTSGYPRNCHAGFEVFHNAVERMNAHGKFEFFIDPELASVRTLSGKTHYAVANGCTTGVFETYE